METLIAGHTAILRHEGRLVMGWIGELGLLRYGDSVAEVLDALEEAARRAPKRRVHASVAARRMLRWEQMAVP